MNQLVLALLDVIQILIRELPTKGDLKTTENKIMSELSDYADQMDAHLKTITDRTTAVADDISVIKAKLQELQSNAGQLSPENKARLTESLNRAKAAAEKLTQIDESNPPPTPQEPPATS
jgi:chaperonin cofactor prefoldin